MPRQFTGDDYESLSWHDNYVYGVQFSILDWNADLVLDIDHILEWVCGVDGGAQFRVAPAALAFHNVTDLNINVDWGDSGFQTALHEMSIHRITRERITNQKICLDRPYYRWAIETNWPKQGNIAFGASGFTMTLRAEPVLQDQQQLARKTRAAWQLNKES